MEKYIDLHVHSTASDGTCSPAELVELALSQGLAAFALTDHDSIDGVEEALKATAKTDLDVIPGVELSTEYKGTEIHVVGLYIDYHNQPFIEHLKNFQDCRDNRNLKMIEKLQEEGFSITADELYETFGDCVLTRAHIARHLVDTKQVKELSVVFDKYIGNGCKCYVERSKITPVDAVKLIHSAGGTAILAHPCLYKMKRSELLEMVKQMAEVGLDGIEAMYSCNQGSDEKDFTELAAQYGMVISGGSDFHGSNKPYIKLGSGKGNLKVPYKVLENIKRRRG